MKLRWWALFSCCFMTPALAAQPSFDCANAIRPLAKAICSDPSASAADWQLVSAYWAAYALRSGATRTVFKDQHIAWLKSLDGDCNLDDRIRNEQGAKSSCVADRYRRRAEGYLKALPLEAAAEGRLSPDGHKLIQRRLNEMGFPNQGLGIFGASTREAISNYQATLGETSTGFLSQKQTKLLIDNNADASTDRAETVRKPSRQSQDERAAQAIMQGFLGALVGNQRLPLPSPTDQSFTRRETGQSQVVGRPPTRHTEGSLGRDEEEVSSRFGDASSAKFERPDSTPNRSASDGLRTVEVTGTGETIEGARADASRQAVQQVAGLYVDARRKVESKVSDTKVNDVVDEKIITYTNAYVKNFEVLGTEKKGDLLTMRAKVAVAVAPIVKILQDNAVPTVAVDTDTAASTADTLAQEKRASMDIYADLIARSANLISVGVGKPEIDASLPSSADAAWLSIPVTFKLNDMGRDEWRSKFELIAKSRAVVEVNRARQIINGKEECAAPTLDVAFARHGPASPSFLNENTSGSEHGVAACFIEEGGYQATCLGRKFVVDAPTYPPCVKAGQCLFLSGKTRLVGLVFEMLDRSGNHVFTAKIPFTAYPAINIGLSSAQPRTDRPNFFNYCIPHQSPFFTTALKDNGYPFGDVLLFPPSGSQIRGYYNQLLPNDTIGRIASVSAKIVQNLQENPNE